MGGTGNSRLCSLALQIWKRLEEKEIERLFFCVDTLKGECRGRFLIKGDFKYLGIILVPPDFQYVNKNMAPPGHRPLCLTTMPSGSEVLFIGTGQESDGNGCNGSVKVTSSPCTNYFRRS
ncbi:unnamed protein product [Lepeophtheirus salmonis]|uniref:(salmon louse) hypothetical protein n=1 Tax=Lepeophtheirus salmonis TaxID=72036 RepID=A0A817FF58_LEPSM|nr:unnamed protein product [Lepeophtheirus salmonis]CAG9477940.1 unnamed protein product [Lepeophtheirus salmonis]